MQQNNLMTDYAYYLGLMGIPTIWLMLKKLTFYKLINYKLRNTLIDFQKAEILIFL